MNLENSKWIPKFACNYWKKLYSLVDASIREDGNQVTHLPQRSVVAKSRRKFFAIMFDLHNASCLVYIDVLSIRRAIFL